MKHLNDDQIARCLASDASPEALDHLSMCAECGIRLAQTQSAFTALRHTLSAASIAPARTVSTRPNTLWRYALVAAALVLAVIPLYYQPNATTRPTTNISSTASLIDDDTLLRDIENEVSRPVTPSLERLELLMVSESSTRQ